MTQILLEGRAMTEDLPSARRSLLYLRFQAVLFRFLMMIGMFFHRTATPSPPRPTFVRTIKARTGKREGDIRLAFYAPDSYNAHLRTPIEWRPPCPCREDGGSAAAVPGFPSDGSHTGSSDADSVLSMSTPTSGHPGSARRLNPLRRLLGKRHRYRSGSTSQSASPSYSPSSKKFPIVVNFHGGGFTLGSATDDCRWATEVVRRTGAVVVSVDYRLAPEYPFPTAVEDGADAIIWLALNGAALDLDPNNIVISGFSSGGNLAFTVPLWLSQVLKPHGMTIRSGKVCPAPPQMGRNELSVPVMKQPSPVASPDGIELLAVPPSSNRLYRTTTASTVGTFFESPEMIGPEQLGRNSIYLHPLPARGAAESTPALVADPDRVVPADLQFHIRGIVSFYPSLDYTMSRRQRRATCSRPDMHLSEMFTRMFDDSYIGSANLLAQFRLSTRPDGGADPESGPSSAAAAVKDLARHSLRHHSYRHRHRHDHDLHDRYQHDQHDDDHQEGDSSSRPRLPRPKPSWYFAPDHPSLSTASLDRPDVPADEILALASPFLSPAVAHDDVLDALPDDIVLLAAEWDMLRWETKRFASRLADLPSAEVNGHEEGHCGSADEYGLTDTGMSKLDSPMAMSQDDKRRYHHNRITVIGGVGLDDFVGETVDLADSADPTKSTIRQAIGKKRVRYWCVPEAPHAWDKKPYFWGRQLSVVGEWYGRACLEIDGMVVNGAGGKSVVIQE